MQRPRRRLPRPAATSPCPTTAVASPAIVASPMPPPPSDAVDCAVPPTRRPLSSGSVRQTRPAGPRGRRLPRPARRGHRLPLPS
ncbi:hypothetical protein U9M48_028124 [Paspalum notatum var. saurae]|uniref:Uncharacterized protein n=1 Tax=Paspalum notatum var. saurae TaxID=547442 RepID=A0AAQ3X094_PASNO